MHFTCGSPFLLFHFSFSVPFGHFPLSTGTTNGCIFQTLFPASEFVSQRPAIIRGLRFSSEFLLFFSVKIFFFPSDASASLASIVLFRLLPTRSKIAPILVAFSFYTRASVSF